MSKAAHHQGLGHRLRSPSTLLLIGLNLFIYFLMARWVSENIHPATLADYCSRIPVWALLGSLAFNLLALALYGVRMALLLNRDFFTAFSIINIGYALNTLLPLRIGEGIKLYLGRRLFAVPLTGIFAASVAEKLFDLVKILLLGAVTFGFASGDYIQVTTLAFIGVFVFAAAGSVVIFRRHIVRIVKLLPRGGRLRRVSIELHKHAGSYPMLRILVVTICIWFLNIALVFFTFNTYLPGLHVSILEAIVLLLIIALAIAIPSAPAGIGFFEAGIVAYLTQRSGVGADAALAAASVFHIVITLPQVLMTAWLMWRQRALALKEKLEAASPSPGGS